jgi:glyoxylase-like metal-dependent hydrolase (beta-lactamase superfamily II)
MKMFNFTTPASPEDALPTVTFNDSISFHMNGEDIQVFHVPNAHTDGDGLVHYVKNNIIQTGDTYFNGIYPYIDLGVGGSIEGMIKSGHRVIDLADDATIIIPGHGKISNKKELATFVKMLETIRDNVKKLIDAGKSSDEVVAAKPTKEYDAVWGNGFMKPDVFAGIVYTSLGGK